ncbi:MAG: tetratricopeptide repeat protein, partial [Myxococcota bacterium]
TCAHARLPLTGGDLAALDISRKMRLRLLSLGLLSTCGTDENKSYAVHPLVRSCLRIREILDFDTLVRVGRLHAAKGKELEGADRVAHVQEANRCFVAARNGRETIKLKYPDYDPEIESATGMIRSQRPHFDMAQQRIVWVLNQGTGNSDAHLLKMELMRRLDAPREAQEGAIQAALEQAPVAEVFQDACTYYLVRRARPKAIGVLEQGVAAMPGEARLKTRLASLLLRQGRRNEALELLQNAMDQAPMLPDPYGLMGMARYDEGAESLSRAEELLREAVRLAPEDRVQIPRLITVLLAKARVAPVDQMAAIRDEARELLAPITRDDSKSAEGFLMLARLERESNNLERAEWLLKQARKHTEKRKGVGNRLRLEWARINTQRGELDKAEAEIRQLVERDQANPSLFIALSEVLEARQLFIPAHAELLRASERVAANTLQGQHVQTQLKRLQAVIEAQAASVGAAPTPTESIDVGPKPPRPVDHARTIRRPANAGEDAAAGASATAGESAEEAVKPMLDKAAGLVAAAAGAVVETVANMVDDVQGKSDPEGDAKAGQNAEEVVGKVGQSVAEGLASAVHVVADTVADVAESVSDALDGGAKSDGPADLGEADDATEES